MRDNKLTVVLLLVLVAVNAWTAYHVYTLARHHYGPEWPLPEPGIEQGSYKNLYEPLYDKMPAGLRRSRPACLQFELEAIAFERQQAILDKLEALEAAAQPTDVEE